MKFDNSRLVALWQIALTRNKLVILNSYYFFLPYDVFQILYNQTLFLPLDALPVHISL